MTDAPAILQVEDSAADALLVQRELRRRWPDARFGRVDTVLALRQALADQPWDAVLSDQIMPGFSAEAALAELRAAEVDAPFLIVSGAIATEAAVDLMRAGAHDFVRKDDLSRLLPALERELAQAEVRRRERWERQERLASEARFRHLVENGADAMLIVGPDGLVRFGNRRAGGLFGLKAGELIGMAFDLPPLLGENIEMEVASADGRGVCVDVRVTATHWQGEDCHLVNLHDLTVRRRAEAQLRELAYLDPLTHLPNRRLLVDRMQQALAQNRRIGQLVAVCYLDLDGFKAVNDTLGHELGDRLLIEVAQRIRGLLRAEDTLARIGGDE
ncbi:MAG: diguanylate cyclase domain-containing protein, partial [Candidatus Methylumidiphilus sp.]